LSTLSMEVKGALLFIKQVMFQRSCATGVSGPFYLNFFEYEMLIEREVCLLSLLF